jgi:hypothetical protein
LDSCAVWYWREAWLLLKLGFFPSHPCACSLLGCIRSRDRYVLVRTTCRYSPAAREPSTAMPRKQNDNLRPLQPSSLCTYCAIPQRLQNLPASINVREHTNLLSSMCAQQVFIVSCRGQHQASFAHEALFERCANFLPGMRGCRNRRRSYKMFRQVLSRTRACTRDFSFL